MFLHLHLCALQTNSAGKPTIRDFLISLCGFPKKFSIRSFTPICPSAKLNIRNAPNINCKVFSKLLRDLFSYFTFAAASESSTMQRASLDDERLNSMIDWKANAPRLHFACFFSPPSPTSTLRVSWIIDATLWCFTFNLFIIRCQ